MNFILEIFKKRENTSVSKKNFLELKSINFEPKVFQNDFLVEVALNTVNISFFIGENSNIFHTLKNFYWNEGMFPILVITSLLNIGPNFQLLFLEIRGVPIKVLKDIQNGI